MAHPHVPILTENWLDEVSAEWLYLRLADLSGSDRRQTFFRELAEFENRHAAKFAEALRAHGGAVPHARVKTTHRLFALFARLFGVGSVLPVLHRGEAHGLEMYRRQLTTLAEDGCKDTVREIIPDELDHEVDLWKEIAAPQEGETEARRGRLRSSILGANDGLGSILALVAGVAGATASNRVVLIAGIAGLIAGSVSMAASNYISVKSEQESYEARRELTSVSLEVAPDVKRGQLKAHYEDRGFPAEEAEMVVSRIANDREEMLNALLTAEHGLTSASFENPRRLSLWTGIAFTFAGAVPILPFLFLAPTPGLIAAVVLSAIALFIAGVLRTLVTLRDWLRSGVEMMLIGMGSAAATYAVGLLIAPFV